ncbi:MAG: metallophosphoesterase, partial [Pedobacter sp.]
MNRVFVIGDIHGCYDELIALLEKVAFDDEDFLVALGDIVDRGNKSKEVYHFFKDRANAVVLIGNHERKHINGVLSYAQEIVKLQLGDEYDDFLKWLKGKPYYYELAEAIVVHAAYEDGKVPSIQKEEVLSGATSGQRYLNERYPPSGLWNDHYRGEKMIVYGHQVVGDFPKTINNTIGIDTGACNGGFLTALELPGFNIHQVASKRDYWKEEQKIWQLKILQSKPWVEMSLDMSGKLVDKLSFVQEPDVLEFLIKLKAWFKYLDDLLPEIIKKIEALTISLMKESGADFSLEARNYAFYNLIFKCRNGNLSLNDLEKFNTPLKRVVLARELGIE